MKQDEVDAIAKYAARWSLIAIEPLRHGGDRHVQVLRELGPSPDQFARLRERQGSEGAYSTAIADSVDVFHERQWSKAYAKRIPATGNA